MAESPPVMRLSGASPPSGAGPSGSRWRGTLLVLLNDGNHATAQVWSESRGTRQYIISDQWRCSVLPGHPERPLITFDRPAVPDGWHPDPSTHLTLARICNDGSARVGALPTFPFAGPPRLPAVPAVVPVKPIVQPGSPKPCTEGELIESIEAADAAFGAFE